MEEVFIREITQYEVMLAIEVFNREFKKRALGNNEWLQEMFEDERKTKNKEILQQYINGEVKIFGLYDKWDKFMGTVMLQGDLVRHLAVRKYYQGMGYGSKLLEFVSDYAKKQGVKKLKVVCVGKNTPLYERNGFKIIGDINYNRFPHYEMEKDL